jgi:hypothetical protein
MAAQWGMGSTHVLTRHVKATGHDSRAPMGVLVLGLSVLEHNESTCIAVVSSPILALQILLIEVEHWQARRR